MRLLTITLLLLVAPGMLVAGGDPVKGKDKAILCIGCHGIDGNSSSSTFPKLAGQGEVYLAKQISDFKTGARQEEHMTSMVETIEVADISDIAAYFSSQKRQLSTDGKLTPQAGKQIYHAGIKSKGIAACASCHGIKGLGNPIAGYPLLAGQHAEYIAKALREFRSGTRSNDPEKLMRTIASKLSNREMDSLSAYIAGMK